MQAKVQLLLLLVANAARHSHLACLHLFRLLAAGLGRQVCAAGQRHWVHTVQTPALLLNPVGSTAG